MGMLGKCMQAPMKVVILAGDFHSSLVEEIYDELAILKKRPG
jgi:hypothetical protein